MLPRVIPRDPVLSEMQIAAGRFDHHGGRLGIARSLYPDVPQPWMDLSTGINPRPYPAPRASQRARNRLPDATELARLEALAAAAFGVDDPSRSSRDCGHRCALRLLPQSRICKRPSSSGRRTGSHADAWTRSCALTTTIGRDEVALVRGASESASRSSIPTIPMGTSSRARSCWPCTIRSPARRDADRRRSIRRCRAGV